jgi:hypothetical protein
MKITLTTLTLVILLGLPLHAADAPQLTTPEKARTASFVFKVERVLGRLQPSGKSEWGKHRVFLKKWLTEDATGISDSKAGQPQKERMRAFVDDLDVLFEREITNPKFKDKTIVEIAMTVTDDLRAIASAAGLTLECDRRKEAQNQRVHGTR